MTRSLVIALALLTGCAQILDLEERTLERDASTNTMLDATVDGTLDASQEASTDSAAPTLSCAEYCKDARELCTAEQGFQLFQTDDTCMAVCAKYSTDPSTTGNTLACRLQQLRGLRATGSNEAPTSCPAASPGGGAAPSEPDGVNCGTNCESFCQLRSDVCPVMAGDLDCVRKCAALVDDKPYNANANFGSGEDSLSCRIAHLSAATYYDSLGDMKTRDAHCSHSGIRSEVQCDFKGDVKITCKSYCKLVGVACTGSNAIYENETQCETLCEGLEPGTIEEKTKPGTRRCLREGAYNALAIGPAQCPKASIAGDDCTGGRCTSYCQLAQKGCAEAFQQKYPTNTQQECVTECLGLPGATSNTPFSVTLAEAQIGTNLQCRLYRLTKALGGDRSPNVCNAALGLAAPCAP